MQGKLARYTSIHGSPIERRFRRATCRRRVGRRARWNAAAFAGARRRAQAPQLSALLRRPEHLARRRGADALRDRMDGLPPHEVARHARPRRLFRAGPRRGARARRRGPGRPMEPSTYGDRHAGCVDAPVGRAGVLRAHRSPDRRTLAGPRRGSSGHQRVRHRGEAVVSRRDARRPRGSPERGRAQLADEERVEDARSRHRCRARSSRRRGRLLHARRGEQPRSDRVAGLDARGRAQGPAARRSRTARDEGGARLRRQTPQGARCPSPFHVHEPARRLLCHATSPHCTRNASRRPAHARHSHGLGGIGGNDRRADPDDSHTTGGTTSRGVEARRERRAQRRGGPRPPARRYARDRTGIGTAGARGVRLGRHTAPLRRRGVPHGAIDLEQHHHPDDRRQRQDRSSDEPLRNGVLRRRSARRRARGRAREASRPRAHVRDRRYGLPPLRPDVRPVHARSCTRHRAPWSCESAACDDEARAGSAGTLAARGYPSVP